MKILGERIIVKKAEKDHSGLIIPENVNLDEISEGKIIALGNRIPKESGCDELEPGDKIQWNVHAGTWTKIEDKVVCILRPNDVICKL